VTEEPPKIVELKKKIGAETIKGDPDAVLTVVGPGPTKLLKRQPNLQHCRYRSET
jgi:protein TonB